MAIEVDPSIAMLLKHSHRLPAFETSSAECLVHMVRSTLPAGRGKPFEGSLAEWGSYEVVGRQLRLCIPDSGEAAESALRIAWAMATMAQSGILIHASGIAVNDQAMVATGPSTFGKSTLAELAVLAGATLLSDEIVQILPGGRCAGTPFRSSLLAQGSPTVRWLRLCVRLEKRQQESLSAAPAADMIRLLCSQAFVHEESAGDLRRRVLQLFQHATFGTLGFRKDPEAGRFVVDLLRRD